MTDLLILAGLVLVALIPRIILATQLDMVTDEIVYIQGGKIYLPLVAHFLSIGASGWTFNYEHPPLVKLFIGLSSFLNAHTGHPLNDLLAARLPSILFGTGLIAAIFWLGRAPFGRVIALLAALCLAVSPWLVYFSALAYLDMPMTALITTAFLLLWHATRRPWLYPLAAALVGFAAASKYTAVLAIPGMILFTLYYLLAIRPRESEPRRPIPWIWMLSTIVGAPLLFLAVDPAIWPQPVGLLIHSFRFEWDHSLHGHLTFIAGQYVLHVPPWTTLYIIVNKLSAFVTIPAAFFALFALVQLVRFHLRPATLSATEASAIAFLLIWLVSILGMFSLLNIVVGTHYLLPIAPPVVLAGAFGLTTLLGYRRGQLLKSGKQAVTTDPQPATAAIPVKRVRISPRAGIIVALLTLALVGPHLVGLLTIPDAEGYTSELFPSENATLQVAYPGYRDALQWLAGYTHTATSVGLVALPATLGQKGDSISWYGYNGDLPARFQLTEAHPSDTTFPYDYLIWPMHLVQRNYLIPEPWRSHIIHVVMGGNTIYCYILAP